jgi:hypothetical protein
MQKYRMVDFNDMQDINLIKKMLKCVFYVEIFIGICMVILLVDKC